MEYPLTFARISPLRDTVTTLIGFTHLRARLINDIRHRIRNGEVTERGLALRAGISQPHLHNILKGLRSLNAAAGDELLSKLGLTAVDLLESDELRRALFVRGRDSVPALEVPVLKGWLEPGGPLPHEPSPFERVKVPLRFLSRMSHPTVARLGDDPAMTPAVNAGDLVLLDTSPAALEFDDPQAQFAVERRGGAAVRWVRQGRLGVYLLSAATEQRPRAWEVVEDGIIRARAIPLRSMHEPVMIFDPLVRPGATPQGPARRAVRALIG